MSRLHPSIPRALLVLAVTCSACNQVTPAPTSGYGIDEQLRMGEGTVVADSCGTPLGGFPSFSVNNARLGVTSWESLESVQFTIVAITESRSASFRGTLDAESGATVPDGAVYEVEHEPIPADWDGQMVTTVETLVFDAPGQARTRHRVTLSGCEGEPWSESCDELDLDPPCETTLEWSWTAPTDD